MNPALMNQNALPYVAPPGPLASAPAASADNVGMLYLETGDPLWPNGRLWSYRRGARNAGTDFINLGRPNALINLFTPANDFTVEMIAKHSSETMGNLFALAFSGLQTESQIRLLHGTSSRGPVAALFGLEFSISVFEPPTSYRRYKIVKKGNTGKLFSNNNQVTQNITGASYLDISNIYLGGRTDGISANFEGDVCCFNVWSGANLDGSTNNLTPVVNWKLDEPMGSTQVIDSVGGLIGAVSDGSPTGYIGTPMLVPIQW